MTYSIPFCFKDRAKTWLEYFTPLNISTWVELEAPFLKKFFLAHKTISLKNQISTFTGRECEVLTMLGHIYGCN